ncbi:MAG: HupE/UreJ family protein [Methylococcaceae bacterium]|nr:HupE/UreJ family protein [Methylococcaceae bacterium]
MKFYRLPFMLMLMGLAGTASAHTGIHPADGLLSGFVHPLSGWDHLLAMVGVGLWAAFLTPDLRQVWRLPAVFMIAMVAGGAWGAAGLPLAHVELAVAFSVFAMGAMVAGMARPTQGLAMALVGSFALCHGFIHGAEMMAGTGFASYALGFVCASGLLQWAGILLGKRLLSLAGLYRASGAAIGGLGLILLMQAI